MVIGRVELWSRRSEQPSICDQDNPDSLKIIKSRSRQSVLVQGNPDSLTHAWCTECILGWSCLGHVLVHKSFIRRQSLQARSSLKTSQVSTTHFLRIGGIGAGAFFRPKDRTVILLSPSSLGFFMPASTLLNLVFSSALPRVALTAL